MIASMAVMARERWTDERLDDLTKLTDKGLEENKLEIRNLRSDMNRGFDRADADIREIRSDMKKGFDEVNSRFDEVNGRFDRMQGTMIIGFVTLFASIVASVIAGILATQL
jgi:ribosome recycling factor